MNGFHLLGDVLKRLGFDPAELVDRSGADEQEYVQASRNAVWRNACARGECRYAIDNVRDENPPPVNSTHVCGGYEGVRHVERVGGVEEVVWRWRPCGRHLAWWARRADWLRGERERAKGKGTAASPTRRALDDAGGNR